METGFNNEIRAPDRNESISQAYLRRSQSLKTDSKCRNAQRSEKTYQEINSTFIGITSSRRRTGRRGRLSILLTGDKKKSNPNVPPRTPSEGSSQQSGDSNSESNGFLDMYPAEEDLYFDRSGEMSMSATSRPMSVPKPGFQGRPILLRSNSAPIPQDIRKCGDEAEKGTVESKPEQPGKWSIWPFPFRAASPTAPGAKSTTSEYKVAGTNTNAAGAKGSVLYHSTDACDERLPIRRKGQQDGVVEGTRFVSYRQFRPVSIEGVELDEESGELRRSKSR